MRFSGILAYDALCKTLPSPSTLELAKRELCSRYQILNIDVESVKSYKDTIELLQAFSLCTELLIYYGADCGWPRVYQPIENQRHLSALYQPCCDFLQSLQKFDIQSPFQSTGAELSRTARDAIQEIQENVRILRRLTIVPLHSIMIWMAQDALKGVYERRQSKPRSLDRNRLTDAILLTKELSSMRKTLTSVEIDSAQCDILDKDFELLLKSLEYGLYLSNHTLWMLLDSDPNASGRQNLLHCYESIVASSDRLDAELDELEVRLGELDRSLFTRFFAAQRKAIQTSRFVFELKSEEVRKTLEPTLVEESPPGTGRSILIRTLSWLVDVVSAVTASSKCRPPGEKSTIDLESDQQHLVEKGHTAESQHPEFRCIFWFANCPFETDKKSIWKSHCHAHFFHHTPPFKTKCPICSQMYRKKGFSLSQRTGGAWSERMDCILKHLNAGQSLPHATPDVDVLQYMWQLPLIRDCIDRKTFDNQPPRIFLTEIGY